MLANLYDYSISYHQERFQETPIKPRVPSPPQGDLQETSSSSVASLILANREDAAEIFTLSDESKVLFIQALQAAVLSAENGEAGKSLGKVLPLQGVVNLKTGIIHIAALVPRDEDAFSFDATPCLEHKKPGLFESGRYSPRIFSYQKCYSAGPTAHQQLLLLAVGKEIVSASDTEFMRGIAFNIQVNDSAKSIRVTVDGKSLSINQTAQYLRTQHDSGHELSENEASNNVLKASGVYSDLSEAWLYDCITQGCQLAVDSYIGLQSQSSMSYTYGL